MRICAATSYQTVVILSFINTSCLSRLSWSPCQHTLLSQSYRLLAEKPIIIDLLASLCARNGQKHPASLSSARNISSKRQLDDTVSWHTLGICPSLWTVNESATDDISHYEKPGMAPLHCSQLGINSTLYFTGDDGNAGSFQLANRGRTCCLSWADKWHINTLYA